MTTKKHSHKNQAELFEDAIISLKSAGLKITDTRKLVLSYLTKSHGPYTIEEIHAGIRSKSCNITTLYRILSHFVEIGIVRKSDLGDRIARFEYQSDTHLHHHLICTLCKKVEVIEQERIPDIAKIAKHKGFFKINPCLEIFGTCNDCAN